METDLKFRPFPIACRPGLGRGVGDLSVTLSPRKEIPFRWKTICKLFPIRHYTADGIWSDGRLIGILYYWTAPEYVYIEHLAISPDLRGANMGSRVLEGFLPEGRTTSCWKSIRRRRKSPFAAFDFTSGWGSCATIIIMYIRRFQRPYEPHQLVLMSYPKAMTDEE